MNRVKWIVINVVAWTMLVLLIGFLTQRNINQKLRREYNDVKTTLNGFIHDKEDEITELKLSLDMPQHTSDSTIQALLEQKEKLEIKDKELVYMMALLSQSKVHDTIKVTTHDTIFVEPDFKFDTCVSDEWRATCVEMKYPNEVYVDATMRSQKEVFVTAKRETINPPARCFLIRLFQKKHTVARITINEENPYIENQENVYIRVVE